MLGKDIQVLLLEASLEFSVIVKGLLDHQIHFRITDETFGWLCHITSNPCFGYLQHHLHVLRFQCEYDLIFRTYRKSEIIVKS